MYSILWNAFECALPMKAYPSIPTPISRIPSELTRPPRRLAPDLVRDTKPLAQRDTAPTTQEDPHEDFARNLGPRVDGDALRSGRLPARAGRRIDRGEARAAPSPGSATSSTATSSTTRRSWTRRTSTRCSRHSATTGSTPSPPAAPDPLFGRGGLCVARGRRTRRRAAKALRAARFLGRLGAQ